MVAIEDSQISLYNDPLPSFEKLRKLAASVNCSEINRAGFIEQVHQHDNDDLRSGIAYAILGDYKKAVEYLSKAQDSKESLMYLGWCLEELGNYPQAIEAFDKAAEKGADDLMVTLSRASAYRRNKEFDQAEKQLEKCKNLEKVSADYHYQLARLLQGQGQYAQAAENYAVAIELDPKHCNALFHLAYACDLRGDDDAAMDYYKQITNQGPVYVSALLNLAVLYEDHGKYEKALRCIDTVLASHPNHKKAQLFRKDVLSSKTMIYDEEREKRLDRQNQILEIPISDFELSVRSRNCLRKMNINTLGDLLKITEAELLSYKNFGETSLNEIKKILETKSLNLGMAINDKGGTASEKSDIDDADQEMLNKPVEDLELSVRARRCLTRLGVRSIGDLVSKTEAELLGCKNFGVTSLNEIKERLNVFDLSLRTLE